MATWNVIGALLCGAAAALTSVGPQEPDTLFQFADDSPAEWIVVNDGVMGGLSRSEFVGTDAGFATFRGEMSLVNNGGFASVRGYLPNGIPADARVVELRVRGDGRSYQVRLRMGERFDGIAYRAEFEPTFRGYRPRNAAPLTLGDVRQLGLMIADKKTGSFSLDVEWIRAVE